MAAPIEALRQARERSNHYLESAVRLKNRAGSQRAGGALLEGNRYYRLHRSTQLCSPLRENCRNSAAGLNPLARNTIADSARPHRGSDSGSRQPVGPPHIALRLALLLSADRNESRTSAGSVPAFLEARRNPLPARRLRPSAGRFPVFRPIAYENRSRRHRDSAAGAALE